VTYRPAFRKQGDGSRCQWQNCNPTSHAMAVDRATRGSKVGSQVAIRNRINLFCPGTSMLQNHDAVRALYAVPMDVKWDYSWSEFLAGIKSGRGAVVTIMYSTLHNTPYDACRTFDGRHAIYVNEWRHNSTTNRDEFLVYDPLADHRYSWIPQGPQWWPASLLQKAMLASYSSDGSNSVEAAFTANTEWVNRKTTCGLAKLRVSPSSLAVNKDSIPAGTTLYTSVDPIVGATYDFTACGVRKTGNKWYAVTAVNGKSVASLYGVPVVYVSLGWF